jgi:hypothetical protein
MADTGYIAMSGNKKTSPNSLTSLRILWRWITLSAQLIKHSRVNNCFNTPIIVLRGIYGVYNNDYGQNKD